ncbi:CPBP family intramembrane glutamic endopeptidase [Sediminibacillus albus]|uniref:CAAX prenyl protease 2/Lysostaphin resistance protein A-like domain-containing protein n=1 Tax=Sediminibacillus albus TaxID=407036 RepID=A0A1G8VLL0_9BACI|nr:CPBP family intramembrane glutamic endopeptidase [Sediminibacillus albus]SDJ66859.1 hypothetical protein SAMN05216243_0194 [Sediminibacillus albus]
MKKLSQAELIKRISVPQLKKQLYLSQLLFFLAALASAGFLFDSANQLIGLIKWQPFELIYYGIGSGIAVILTDLLLMRIFPAAAFDDGGLNAKLFKNCSVPEIFLIALVVAVAEETLFRGVLHTEFGFIFASSIFALVHFRYLKKPLLLLSVIFVSFLLGWMFELTNNLLVTITAHFVIDFTLGILIAQTTSGEEEQ